MTITTSQPKRRLNKQSFAHQMVANLQIEMAHAVYDELATKDDKFFHEWAETDFVNMVAPTLRDEARRTLGEMLTQPGVTEQEKNDIYTALVLDHKIPNEDRWHQPATMFVQ